MEIPKELRWIGPLLALNALPWLPLTKTDLMEEHVTALEKEE